MKPSKQIKTAYIYTRVSSRQQAIGSMSLDAQKEIIKDYCRKNNIRIVDVFSDYPESAKNLKRKGLVRMIARVIFKPVDFIIVTCLDRLFRNHADYFTLRYKLSKFGTQIKSLSQENPPLDFYEEIYKAMEAFQLRPRVNDDCDCVNG